MEKINNALAYISTLFESSVCTEPKEVLSTLKEAKTEAVKNGDEALANQIWVLESIIFLQNKFFSAFKHLKGERFYEAWCDLERSEHLADQILEASPGLVDDISGVLFIHEKIKKIQKLYPYKYFLSPEFLDKEMKCGLCGAKVSIRKHCGHLPGKLYMGEMSYRVVTNFRVFAISLVTNPVQKYSVPFSKDPSTNEMKDDYNYALVQFMVDGIGSPWDFWDYTKSTRKVPHSHFAHIPRDEKCPCGSADSYKNCCLKMAEVTMPHLQFTFENPPDPQKLKHKII